MQPRISSEEKSIHQGSFFKPKDDKESKITIDNILNKEYLDNYSCLFGCYTSTKTIQVTEKEDRLYTDKFDDHGMRLCPLTSCVVFSVLDDFGVVFQIKIAKDSLIKAFSNPKYNSDGSIRITVYKNVYQLFNGDYIEDICEGHFYNLIDRTDKRSIELTFLNDNLNKIRISNYNNRDARDLCYNSVNLTSNKELNMSIKKK